MAEDTLIFACEGAEYEIELTAEYAPDTLAALRASLPAAADIHCAKIAGCHIMWPVPFVRRVEKAADVMTMAPGSFFYWPERQYLEITYDELQAESAAVSVLGRLKGDTGWLRNYADRNRREQGRCLFMAEVFMKGAPRAVRAAPPSAGTAPWSRLRAARLAAWQMEPAEIGALMARDGLMMPFGPLAMAEGEMRKLHELLWRLWNERDGRADGEKAGIAGFVLEAAITRVAGFCHMTETGAVLRDGIECLGAGEPPLEAVLEELVLYSGRIAASLDLRIQWWGMNEITLGAREGR
jgi:hypothetical protein